MCVMIGIRSKFREEVYAYADKPAKEAVAQYLNEKWNCHTDITERCGPDVYAWRWIRGQWKYSWHECEMRDILGDDFPFCTIHIPSRKERLKQYTGNGWYWVVSPNLARALVIRMLYVFRSPRIEVPNSREKSGEYFYDVPLFQSKLIELK